jgi:hypothetical protein
MTTDASWVLDFVIREAPGSRKGKFGSEWYEHAANVRVTMAAEPGTLVTRGITGVELEKQMKRPFEKLGMLVARREGVRQTVFVATHEPYANAVVPTIIAVTTLARSDRALLVRVDTSNYTDYAAVSFGPQPGAPEHVLVADDEAKTSVAFTDYGYLRVYPDGTIAARGGWKGLRLPAVKGTLTLNGQSVPAGLQDGCLTYGTVPPSAEPATVAEVECPLAIQIAPAVARLEPTGRRTLIFTVKNTLKATVSGSFMFELPAGITVEPSKPAFTSLRPGKTAQVPVIFIADAEVKAGKAIVPYRVTCRTGSAAPSISAALPVMLTVGPVLRAVYQHPERNVFQVDAPRYTIQHDMFSGLCRHLADDDDIVRLDGDPLFTFSNGKSEILFPGTVQAFVWPTEAPAHLAAHALDICRYHVSYGSDRITVSMNSVWTQFDPTHFTVPGRWVSTRGRPTWARIVAVDASGREVAAKPGTDLKLVAAELAFPGAKWHVAFSFTPPQPVTLNGAEMRFPIGSLNGEAWSVGFCKPGKLDDWRRGPVQEERVRGSVSGRQK